MQLAGLNKASRILRMRARAERLRPVPTTRSRITSTGTLLELVPQVSPHLHEPTHLKPIADACEDVLDKRVELCVSVPPRHGKTTLLLHLIAWVLLRDPTATILYASYAHGFAAKQVRKAMKIAQRAGVALGDVRRRDEWTTAEGGGVKACGVGGQITGEGFRLIIVDDPHKNRAEAESRRIRERVIDGFLADIYTRQDPRGTSVLVVHTRWHEGDLIGHLTRPGGSDEGDVRPFRLVNLAAIDSRGRALAPRLFDVARLRQIRARVGEFAWASLYDGSPRPKGGLLFGDVTLVEELEDGGSYRYAIGIDIAHTARTRSDWNVAVVMRRDTRTGMIDVVHVERHQGTLTDRVEGRGAEPIHDKIDEGFLRKLHALTVAYPAAPVSMYCAKDETLIVGLVARHDRYPIRIRATVVEKDKWTRAQPYAGAWNDSPGRVRLPRKARWVSEFVQEHVAFTGAKGERDDQVDAAASAYDELMKVGGPRGRARGTGDGGVMDRLGGVVAA